MYFHYYFDEDSVMAALNKHERFILESSIIPLNASPFVYWKETSLKTSWKGEEKWKIIIMLMA